MSNTATDTIPTTRTRFAAGWVVVFDLIGRFAGTGRLTLVRTVDDTVAVRDNVTGEVHAAGCSDLVEDCDEDGPFVNRCGHPIAWADRNMGSCEGHAAERRRWSAQSEAERAEWERRIDAA